MMYCSTTSSQKATGCFSQLGIGQGIGSNAPAYKFRLKPRKTWLALLQMLQEDVSWTSSQISCPLLKLYEPAYILKLYDCRVAVCKQKAY